MNLTDKEYNHEIETKESSAHGAAPRTTFPNRREVGFNIQV